MVQIRSSISGGRATSYAKTSLESSHEEFIARDAFMAYISKRAQAMTVVVAPVCSQGFWLSVETKGMAIGEGERQT